MSEENVIRLYTTRAAILSRRTGTQIKFTIRRKEDGSIVGKTSQKGLEQIQEKPDHYRVRRSSMDHLLGILATA